MEVIKTAIPEVLILKPKVWGDERGYFYESFRQQWFDDLDMDIKFVQDNQSSSQKNVLRGLHYQIQKPQGKLVRVISGEVFDVAVDLRKSSPTFGQSVGVNLSTENKLMLWIPAGFAHGFCVVSEHAELYYKCTEYYAPEFDRSLLWNDADLNIQWPIGNASPILSPKDLAAKSLAEAEVYA
ncbi:dTDP-4-dehydrorhamnose 3,5-epimerase [Cellvibrio zantedeschiae]|uniref:dTDP-4-dehydrorhamnose 3,5-epimerase n=1 Tax=Cellvibrio zantedeschiae TaxID=1237077 RepID=A0ABQ3B6U8_9GAMM|nr:dTDP-4-dehydrorhamnose 3,5-epimerase [Cellvibrio zantedeschiae]GGY82450.1 dTDP-4-dehydrorhamnose 3,5-epimerase [Cellvibrio zantedeschiae]